MAAYQVGHAGGTDGGQVGDVVARGAVAHGTTQGRPAAVRIEFVRRPWAPPMSVQVRRSRHACPHSTVLLRSWATAPERSR